MRDERRCNLIFERDDLHTPGDPAPNPHPHPPSQGLWREVWGSSYGVEDTGSGPRDLGSTLGYGQLADFSR